MESLDAGVFTYTELDPVTNGFYQQIISKKMLSQCLGQTHQGEIGRSDGSRQCILDRTSHSGIDVRTGGSMKFRPITRLSPLEAETPNEHTCNQSVMICFSKTMKSIFGTLELRSLNPFPFYLTSVVFSMDWKSRIMRQSKIAREVKFVRIAHGG